MSRTEKAIYVAVTLILFVGFLIGGTRSARSADTDVVGHRGTANRPENTIPGITNAARQGAAWVELDVRETADGYLRLLHDATLDATTTCTGPIANRTRRHVASCRAVERWPWYRPTAASHDGRHPVPSFDAAVTEAERRQVGVIVDAKTGLRNPRLLDRVNRATVPVRIHARTHADITWAAARTHHPVGWCCRWPMSVSAVGEAGGSYIAAHHSDITRDRVDTAHARGLDVHVWTVRAQNRWLPARYRTDGSRRAYGDVAAWHRHLRGLGVDFVYADEPARAP